MKLIDILPKIPQYEDIPYAPDFNCPECDKSPKVIGWTETNIGKMGVFECPCCGQKFRFHCTIGTWTADDNEFDLYLYYIAKKCSNWEQIKNKLGEKYDV